MTRNEKISYIKKELPSLYEKLSKSVPVLLKDPNNSAKQHVIEYNKIIFNYIFVFADYPLIETLSF